MGRFFFYLPPSPSKGEGRGEVYGWNLRLAVDKSSKNAYGSPPPFLLNNPLLKSTMKLFRKKSATNAIESLVRQSEEGELTDSRPFHAPALIAISAARQTQFDEILEGFVSDPAIFAATVSHLAGASLPPATIESLLDIRSIDDLRELAKDFDATTVMTGGTGLGAFLGKEGDLDPDGNPVDNVMNAGPDGRAWLMLVAGHLSLLRANRENRPLLYPFNQPKH